MANNKGMAKAKDKKNDEFYTVYSEIQSEINHYEKHFVGKTVFCNCDDPYESNFFQFFARNFNYLKLKRLICTCFSGSSIAYTQLSLFDNNDEQATNKFGYVIDIKEVPMANGRGVTDEDINSLLKSKKRGVKKLEGNGDFRSKECIEYLEQSDIVVTNPPFSLFKEYIAQLVEYDKRFLVISNIQTIKYKEIFPLILNNQLWAGYSFNKTMEFIMPNSYELKGKAFVDKLGRKHGFVPGICWLTNLDIDKRHENIILHKRYNPQIYKKYDNYDAIEIKNVSDIPKDYSGHMGVPISFMEKYNPNQFDLIGSSDISDTLEGIQVLGSEWIKKYKEQGGTGHYTANMKSVGYSGDGKNKIIFSRIIIKNKHPEKEGFV
jgi:hypothetical protein